MTHRIAIALTATAALIAGGYLGLCIGLSAILRDEIDELDGEHF